MPSRAVQIACITLFAFCSKCIDSAHADSFTDALAQQGRSTADLQRDATSKPIEVLTFFGVEPGMIILDVLGGDGYYSEILAHSVGPHGRVYLHNNQAYAGLMAGISARLANDRLPNVIAIVQEIEDILLATESIDMVLAVMVYHDVYYTNNGWTVTPERFFAMIKRVLKPGGILGIVDHNAQPGSGVTFTQNLHRIDAQFARRDIDNRGFEFLGSIDVLENPTDVLTESVFEPEIRGRTSRFVHKYRKH
jgi:predicted methyltransferase